MRTGCGFGVSLGTFITVFVGLIAIIVTLGLFTLNKIEANAIFRQHTEDQLSSIQTQVVSLRALVSSNQPLKRQNQEAAKELLAEARSKAIASIPAATVERAGKAFVEASQSESHAWAVAVDFVTYRTSLNTSPASISNLVADPSYYYIRPANGKPKFTEMHRSLGAVPIAQAAHLDLIGADANAGNKNGPPWLFASGGTAVLDGEHIRHVVFTGVEIPLLWNVCHPRRGGLCKLHLRAR